MSVYRTIGPLVFIIIIHDAIEMAIVAFQGNTSVVVLFVLCLGV